MKGAKWAARTDVSYGGRGRGGIRTQQTTPRTTSRTAWSTSTKSAFWQPCKMPHPYKEKPARARCEGGKPERDDVTGGMQPSAVRRGWLGRLRRRPRGVAHTARPCGSVYCLGLWERWALSRTLRRPLQDGRETLWVLPDNSPTWTETASKAHLDSFSHQLRD